MTTELQPVALGFDGITPDAANDPTEYDVQFTPASNSGGDDSGTPKAEQSEEIRLLDEARAKDSHSPSDEEKVREAVICGWEQSFLGVACMHTVQMV